MESITVPKLLLLVRPPASIQKRLKSINLLTRLGELRYIWQDDTDAQKSSATAAT
jgi:hypothetical protein